MNAEAYPHIGALIWVMYGLGAIIGSFLGSPFPPAVYIGHPG